jgi:hypothetical protein
MPRVTIESLSAFEVAGRERATIAAATAEILLVRAMLHLLQEQKCSGRANGHGRVGEASQHGGITGEYRRGLAGSRWWSASVATVFTALTQCV